MPPTLGPAKNAGQIHGYPISKTAPVTLQVLKYVTNQWVPSNVPAAGSTTQLMFNDGGTDLGGSADLTFDKTTKVVTLAGRMLFGAGTATLSPIKFTAGVNLTVPEAGSLEFDGTYLWFTQGTTRRALAISGGVSVWTEVTSTTQSLVAANGYIANHATSRVVFTLPSTMAIGQTIRIAGKGAAGWRIAQNAGQQIKFGESVTTTGVDGYVESTYLTDSIEIICTTADTVFRVVSSVGTMEVA